MSAPLILDLDGTLLHGAPDPLGVKVPGRTRHAWLAAATLRALVGLSRRHPLVLATARSEAATAVVLAALQAAEARIEGLVLEDGGCLGPPGALRPLTPARDWPRLQAAILAQAPVWADQAWQADFTHCLVVHAGRPERAQGLAPALLAAAQTADPGADLAVHTDGSKIYLTGAEADKAAALRALLGPRLDAALGVGDGANDRCWLPHIVRPATLAGADAELTAAVRRVGGFVSDSAGHAGIAEVLARFAAPREGGLDGS